MDRRILSAAAALATSGVVVLASCDDVDSYLYPAQKVDLAASCVEAYAPLEIVNGNGGNSECPGTCLSYNGALYVSQVCPPVPPSAELLDPDSGDCIAAIAALDAACGEAAEEDAGEEAGEEDSGGDPDAGEEDAEADAPADG